MIVFGFGVDTCMLLRCKCLCVLYSNYWEKRVLTASCLAVAVKRQTATYKQPIYLAVNKQPPRKPSKKTLHKGGSCANSGEFQEYVTLVKRENTNYTPFVV